MQKHNLAKKDMSLSEYRDKLQMEEFFKKYESEGKQVKLNDVLQFKLDGDSGLPIRYTFDEAQMQVLIDFYQDSNKIRPSKQEKYHVFQCPVSKMNYFYASVPVRNILNDGKEEAGIELQPRPLILEHLWDLYRHLRVNTQLQPSICRINGVDGRNVLVLMVNIKLLLKYGQVQIKLMRKYSLIQM